MNAKPLVSVVIATFNDNPSFLRESINSLLKQTYTNLEIIIVDDSTNQDSRDIIDSFMNDERVHVLREDRKLGFIRSLNKGLSSSTGKYIARMDGDDICYPDRIEKEVDFLEQNPMYAVIGGGMDIINEESVITGERKYPINCINFATYRNPLAHPTVMMRKENVEKGMIYNEKLKNAEDLDLWLRYIINGYRITNLQDKLIKYRVCGDLTNKRNKQQFINDFKIRVNNFSVRHLFFSLGSFIFGFILMIMPMKVFSKLYKKENNSLAK